VNKRWEGGQCRFYNKRSADIQENKGKKKKKEKINHNNTSKCAIKNNDKRTEGTQESS